MTAFAAAIHRPKVTVPYPDDAQTPRCSLGVRRLVRGYSGNVIEVRNSNGTLADIGLSGDAIDESAMNSHAALGDGQSLWVRTIYDQSGNARHAQETTDTNQPKILDGGEYTRGLDSNLPLIVFDGDQTMSIASFGGSNSRDQTIMFVAQCLEGEWYDSDGDNNYTEFIRGNGSPNDLRIEMNSAHGLRASASTPSIGTGDASLDYLPESEGICALRTTESGGDATYSLWLSYESLNTDTGTYAGVAVNSVDVFDATKETKYCLRELHFYPSTTESEYYDLLRAADHLNLHPSRDRISTKTNFPWLWRWQEECIDWIRSKTAGYYDRETANAALSFDGDDSNFSDERQLVLTSLAADRDNDIAQGNTALDLLKYPSRCFTWAAIDDPYDSTNLREVTGYGESYELIENLDLPKNDASQGNPHYQDEGLRRRLACMGLLNLCQMWHEQTTTAFASNNGNNIFTGGQFLSFMDCFEHSLEWLPRDVIKSVDAAFLMFARRSNKMGPPNSQNFVNENITIKTVAALARIHALTKSTAVRAECIRAAKNILTGTPDGEVLANLVEGESVLTPVGVTSEGYGYETSYTAGHAGHHLAQAMGAIDGDGAWDWFRDLLSQQGDWHAYQAFSEPPDEDRDVFQNRCGYGYGNRTGAPYVMEVNGQTDEQMLTYAHVFDNCDPMTWDFKFNSSRLLSDSDLATQITNPNGITYINSSIRANIDRYIDDFDATYDYTTQTWSATGSNLDARDEIRVRLFNTGGSLPTGYTAGDEYRLLSGATANAFQLEVPGVGTPVVGSTDNGIGTHHVRILGTNIATSVGQRQWRYNALHLPKDANWYSTIRDRITSDATLQHSPWRKAANFNVSFGANRFWVYKAGTTGSQYGWLVETLPKTGQNKGYSGGELNTLWFETFGVPVMTGKDKSSDFDWSEAVDYPWFSLWGVGGAGDTKFCSSLCVTIGGALDSDFSRTVTYSTGEAEPRVSYEQTLDPSSSDTQVNKLEWMEDEDELTDAIKYTREFRDIGDGLQVTVDLDVLTSTDQLKELWQSIPIMLRANQSTPAHQDGISDTEIATSTDDVSYTPQNSNTDTNITARYIKLTRDYDNSTETPTSPVSVLIDLQASYTIRVSDVWQASYQSSDRWQVVQVNMLPSAPSGSGQTIADKTLVYTVKED